MIVDTSDQEFIARFWIGYWQGRLLLLQAFGQNNGNHKN